MWGNEFQPPTAAFSCAPSEAEVTAQTLGVPATRRSGLSFWSLLLSELNLAPFVAAISRVNQYRENPCCPTFQFNNTQINFIKNLFQGPALAEHIQLPTTVPASHYECWFESQLRTAHLAHAPCGRLTKTLMVLAWPAQATSGS